MISETGGGSSVQFFIPDTPKLVRKLSVKIKEERDKLVLQLVNAEDHADFKQRVGVIRGLEMALSLCAETQQELYGKH